MICENTSTSKSSQNFILLGPRIWYQISNTISLLLRHVSTSATLIAFRFKGFNYRTMVKVLIHIKYAKNVNHLGIVQNNERTRKNIPTNIKRHWSWKSGVQLILNVTVSLFARWKASCKRIFFWLFKDTNTCNFYFL